ncbi:hypothetical protein WJX82_003197 [Trebouxia sp. C0006]
MFASAWSAGNLLFSEEPLALANVIEITPCPPELDDVCSVTRDLLSSGTHRSLTGNSIFACNPGRWPAPQLLTYLVVANSGLAGNQSDGCNAVQDTVLQAVALSNKGISVSCNKPLDHVRSKIALDTTQNEGQHHQ